MYLSFIRKIRRQDGEEFAEQNLALFAETSALTASNVEEIFIEISEFVCNPVCYCVHLYHITMHQYSVYILTPNIQKCKFSLYASAKNSRVYLSYAVVNIV